MPTKKPTTKLGEYGPPKQIQYVSETRPELSGTYTVELGAEFRQRRATGGFCHTRWARVDGHEIPVYAMIRDEVGDLKVLRDEEELTWRAAERHAWTYVRELIDKEKDEQQKRNFLRALEFAGSWRVNDDKETGLIEIMPIGLRIQVGTGQYATTPESIGIRRVMYRLVVLAKRYGLKDNDIETEWNDLEYVNEKAESSAEQLRAKATSDGKNRQ